MTFTLDHAHRLVGGSLTGPSELGQLGVTQWLYDSRLPSITASPCFLALSGTNRSGLDFVEEVYQGGVRLFCVPNSAKLPPLPEALVWRVDNVLEALQTLAAERRALFTGTVVGITGSNGKTIVKEWLYTLLGGAAANVYRSPQSFNSQLGVALSVLSIPASAKTAIIEAGISRTGEMGRLAAMIQPDLGVLTNIGDAHASGFASTEEKLTEKLELFRKTAQVVVERRTLELYRQVFDGTLADAKLIAWSHEDDESPFIFDASTFSFLDRQSGQMTHLGRTYGDAASQQNLAASLVAARLLGTAPAELSERIAELPLPEMRLRVSRGQDGLRIVDDSYTGDFTGLLAALEFFSQHVSGTGLRVAVLGLASPLTAIQARQLQSALSALDIDYLIGVRTPSIKDLELPGAEVVLVQSADEAITQLEALSLKQAQILLKGPRSLRLDRIAQRLRMRQHEVRLEISLSALASNLATFRARLRSSTKVCIMVKAQAYGSGAAQLASFFEQRGVDYLAVAYLDEGIELRKAGVTLPIIVGRPDPHQADRLGQYHLEPEVSTWAQLAAFAPLDTLKLHLKVDTGMHRLGFGTSADEVERLLTMLTTAQASIASVLSHLSASDQARADEFSRKQADRLVRVHEAISAQLGYRPILHLANSAAAWRLPDLQFDMVRLGIGVYGVGMPTDAADALQPVHRLVAQVIQVRTVAAGEVVGYALSGVANRQRRIAVVNVGYADGLRRAAGQGRYSLVINSEPAPTVGHICMDFCMVDVTDHSHIVKEGDEAIVFGDQPRVDTLAACYGTIVYEVFTGIGHRVRRLYFH